MAADGCVPDEVSAAKAAAFAGFDRRLDPTSSAPLALGLSGGGDSLALLLLTMQWARAAGRRVLALTVDHGLHADSAGWTAEAGAMARSLGASWRPLAWVGAKPMTGVPAAARRARHALLAEAARAEGAAVVLLGHTADDVAESAMIRRETPTHGRLRDWSPSPVWPEGRGVFLLRPLLGVRRAVLRQMLAAANLAWLDDPANLDTTFARARVRASLGRPRVYSGSGLGPPTSPGDTCEEERGRFRTDAGEPAERSGAIVLSRSAWTDDPALLAHALVCAAGQERPPSASALARLAERLTAGPAGTTTLAGAKVVAGSDTVTLCRELGRWPPAPTALPLGEPVVFDGRFEVFAGAFGWRVAPLAGRAARLPAAERRRLEKLAAIVRPSLPVLLGPAGEVRLPRPFGEGPAQARQLVGARLAAALGGIGDERTLARVSRADAVYGA